MKSGHKIPHCGPLWCSDVLNCGENRQSAVACREKWKIRWCKTAPSTQSGVSTSATWKLPSAKAV